MVECECSFIFPVIAAILVLIDTWWNVNTTIKVQLYADGKGFNRYMVECEFFMELIYFLF